jgi:putative phosphoribosyl transferase
MYFASRMQAGKLLAAQVAANYKGEDSSVLAMSDGGVVVGMQIAVQLRAPIGMLLVDEIELPRENVSVAGITQDGSFAYNQAFSSGEMDELVSEYRGVIEQQKLEKLHELHALVGDNNLFRRDLLDNRNIVLVSDGLPSGFEIDLALTFLKKVPYKKFVIVTPLASIKAVDRMHILADDIYCLSAIEDYIDTDHYYDTKDIPPHDVVVQTVAGIVKNWR